MRRVPFRSDIVLRIFLGPRSMRRLAPPIQLINVGGGRIVSRRHGSEVVFSELSSTYPLKLLSPRVTHDSGIALVYILSYGGGLVGGDCIKLSVDVGSGTSLMLLSQVSSEYNDWPAP